MMGGMSRVYSDAEWARRVEKRLARLEDPRVLRVGSWALSAGAGGELWADHATTGRRVRLAGPWESSSDQATTTMSRSISSRLIHCRSAPRWATMSPIIVAVIGGLTKR